MPMSPWTEYLGVASRLAFYLKQLRANWLVYESSQSNLICIIMWTERKEWWKHKVNCTKDWNTT